MNNDWLFLFKKRKIRHVLIYEILLSYYNLLSYIYETWYLTITFLTYSDFTLNNGLLISSNKLILVRNKIQHTYWLRIHLVGYQKV